MSSNKTGTARRDENFWVKMSENRKKRVNTWDNAQVVLADVLLDKQAVKRIRLFWYAL